MDVAELISKDLFRYTGGGKFWLAYFMYPGFKYTFYFRIIQWLRSYKKTSLSPLVLLFKIRLLSLQRYYGIQIPLSVQIGEGFYIGHFGTIVVNGAVKIGKNVNISQGVTIGKSNRGCKEGCPVIGNEVYIAPGAKIIGKIFIGNNVAIGANAVVTEDIPDNACVAGIPAKIISMNGATGYINKKV